MDKVAAATERATDKAAVAVDDATINTKVKSAVFAEPGLATLQIGVDTKEGVVTPGPSTPDMKNRAMEARSTSMASGPSSTTSRSSRRADVPPPSEIRPPAGGTVVKTIVASFDDCRTAQRPPASRANDGFTARDGIVASGLADGEAADDAVTTTVDHAAATGA